MHTDIVHRGGSVMATLAAALLASLLSTPPSEADESEPGRIVMTFTDQAGQPVSGLRVRFERSNEVLLTTGDDGVVDLDPAYPGAYGLCWSMDDGSVASQCWDGQPTFQLTQYVTVAPGQLVDLAVTTAPAAHLAGQVVDDTTGAAVQGAQVGAELLVGGTWYPVQRVQTAFPTTDPEGPATGSYTFDGLAPGTYRVHFVEDQRQWIEQWSGGADSADTAEVMTLGANQTGRADARLVPSAQLLGEVTSPRGRAGSEQVWAFHLEDGSWVPSDWTGLNSRGQYDLDRLPPGKYRLKYLSESYDTLWWKNADSLGSATDIDVSPGERIEDLDVTLSPGEPDRLINLELPRIVGDPVVGSELSFDPGTWEPAASGYTPEWFIDGCMASNLDTLPVGPLMAGHTISLFVTAIAPTYVTSRYAPALPTLGGYQNRCFPLEQAPVTSVRIPGSPPPAPLPPPGWLPNTRPSLLGRPVVGRRLSIGDLGTLPAPGSAVFQWFSDGHRIAGAHARRLKVRPRLRGTRIFARVIVHVPGVASTILQTRRSKPVT
jgi:hypothetical protein